MDLELTNRRALVLGASKGLGAAIARTLATEGADVLAAARNEDATRAWMAELPEAVRARITPQKLDLADRASVDALADAVLAGGGVDILVNNSGGPPPGTARDMAVEAWIQNFQSMAAHIFHLTGRLLPPMVERRWGRVVSIASSGIEQPIPNLALSNGIRMAVLGWSKTLATEVAPHGVTVNVVLPGRIHTDRVVQLDEAAAKRTGKAVEAVAEAARAAIPVGRYGRPQEFADVVTFLASERASFVTGAKIRIDGGQTRSV